LIGSHLVKKIRARHQVIALSRQDVSGASATISGSFTDPETLRLLDPYPIDVVVHLAAETGGCSEEAGMSINVEGTRTLLRYVADRGCARYVIASSIAASGVLSPDFIPRVLPIGDDYSCDAVDAYGLSKWLVEQVTYYFHRIFPEYDFTVFRIGLVIPDDSPPINTQIFSEFTLPFTDTSCIALSDVVAALELAIERTISPGVERLNLVAPQIRSPYAAPDTFKRLLGDRASALDGHWSRRDHHADDGNFSIDRLVESYGFAPRTDVRTMTKRT
jgi:UDP-glucose 4-epimerase